MGRFRILLLSFFIAGLTSTVACDRVNSPTSPGGTGPRINQIDPGVIQAGPSAQTITVTGENFATGLALMVTRPDGSTQTIDAANLDSLNSTSFRTTMVFAATGTYTLTVRASSGALSPGFTLPVQSTSGGPRITSVTPSGLTFAATPQLLVFQGENFSSPMVVRVTDPDGFVTTSGDDAILGLTSTMFQWSFVPAKRGAWSISVQSNTGAQSNEITLTVG